MLGIRVLGRCEISLVPGATSGRLGPKLQGLLAFLAMSRGVVVPRCRLAGLLWSERDEQRARHSLCQALTALRAALGPTAAMLRVCPDGVRLVREDLDLDADAFENAAGSGERAMLQEACDLYRGPFLQGLEIREPDFEEWQLGERYRLAEVAVDAFARLLDLQIAAGETEAAVATARRLVAITPLDEPAHARLIQLYSSLGRRGLAEAQYLRCADLLRRELDQAPGQELRAALAAARRRPPAEPVRIMPGADPARTPERAQDANERAGMAWLLAGTAAAMLLPLAAVWTFQGDSIGDPREPLAYQASPWELPAEPSIAVLPFQNLSRDAEKAPFAAGIANDIITDLSKFSTLFVSASTASSRVAADGAKVQDVARALGVRYVLDGSVQWFDGSLAIAANLTEATTGRQVWGERYERPTANLLAVQKEIAQTITAQLGSGWGELQRAELKRIARIPTADLQAYDLYLRGMAYTIRKSKQGNALARQMFEKAIAADPAHARAMAECSLTYINDIFNEWTDDPEQWLLKAEALARGAIEIDASEPWGFVTLGLVYQSKGESARALPLFEKAHALNPNDFYVKEALGYALTYAGSAEEGIRILEQAERLELDTQEHPWILGGAYFFARRYEDALAAFNRTTDREHSPTYWSYKAATHVQLGQLDEARAAVAVALTLDPGLTLQGEHKRRLALGLAPAYAEQLTEALRKAGLPERTPMQLAR
jgi:TolB-like protein/DNA-binding SARP family transcriptional activator